MSPANRIPGPSALACALALLALGSLRVQAAAPPSGSAAEPSSASLARRAQALLQVSNDYWTREFVTLQASYQPAGLSLYAHPLPDACDTSGAVVGPFYCPNDSDVYLPQDYLQQVAGQAGSSADLALAYVIGHEVGKHIQDLVGTTAQVEQARASSTAELSARTWAVAELQADCFAGLDIRAGLAGGQIARGEPAAALQAVASVSQAQQSHLQSGQVIPDPLQTYATPAQRLAWFQRGLSSGNFADCDTFGAAAAGKL